MAAIDFSRRNMLTGALGGTLAALAGQGAWAAPILGPYEVEGGQFKSFDGAQLFYRRVGKGPPVILLHGLLGDGPRTWFATGVAQGLAGAGFSVIAPDARAHGLSAAPIEAAAYPKDVMALDVEALIQSLRLRSVRLLGYAMGGRTAVRLMVRGEARIERAVLGGVGDRGVTQTERIAPSYAEPILQGRASRDPRLGVAVQAAIRLQRLRPRALLALVRSEPSTPPAGLARIRTPVLVVTGTADRVEGTAEALAALLPAARAEHVAGSHLGALRDRRFAPLSAAFLDSTLAPARFVAPA
jgi:pimeloyl-ACP methyl ester carboxylesterase